MTDSAPESRTNLTDEAADEIAYRAVSPLAVAALVLGLLSPAAFLSPLLWPIPIFAIVFSAFALSRLRRDADRYTGGGLVFAGMLVALLFLGWAPARYMQRMTITEARAAAVAKDWAKLVSDGRLEEAHQWHLNAAARAAPGVSPAAFYAERPEMAKLQQDIYTSGTIAQWVKRGRGSEPKFVGYCGRETVGEDENYVFEFSIRGGDDAGRGYLPAFVIVKREPRESGGGELLVQGVHGLNPFIKER